MVKILVEILYISHILLHKLPKRFYLITSNIKYCVRKEMNVEFSNIRLEVTRARSIGLNIYLWLRFRFMNVVAVCVNGFVARTKGWRETYWADCVQFRKKQYYIRLG